MTNPAGWRAHSPKWYSSSWKDFGKKQMRLDEWTQPEWGDVADYFCERDKKYATAELTVLAVIKLQTENVATRTAQKTLRELMETLDIIPGTLQMAQWTSWSGMRHMRLGSSKPQTHQYIAYHPPNEVPDLSLTKKAKPVQHICFHACK